MPNPSELERLDQAKATVRRLPAETREAVATIIESAAVVVGYSQDTNGDEIGSDDTQGTLDKLAVEFRTNRFSE